MRPVYKLTHKPETTSKPTPSQSSASASAEPESQIAQHAQFDSGHLTPGTILQLQRTYGNQFVVQLLRQQTHPAQESEQVQKRLHSQHDISPVGGQVVQRLPVDKDFVKTELAKTGEGLMALDMLDRVNVYEYQSLKYRGVPKTSYATTLPHENPPVIFVNEKKNSSNEEAANTLYHEVQHAFDPDTPPRDDDSVQALKQDLLNEAKVMKLEAEFAIKMGGNYLQEAVKFGSVKLEHGQYVVNEGLLQKIVSGAYSNYALEKRSARFDLKNYKTEGERDLSGDWYPLEAYKYDIDYSHKPKKDPNERPSYIN